MSGEQKLKDDLEKAVWHRDCTARIARNLAKNVDVLKAENAALKAALGESTAVLESLLNEKFIDDTATHRRYIRIKAAIERAKLLIAENREGKPQFPPQE